MYNLYPEPDEWPGSRKTGESHTFLDDPEVAHAEHRIFGDNPEVWTASLCGAQTGFTVVDDDRVTCETCKGLIAGLPR